MVMVGHSKRLAQPMSRRQSRAVVAVIGVVVVAIAGAILFASLGPERNGTSRNGCVDVVVPSTMGGGLLHQCGRGAVDWCASVQGQRDRIALLVQYQCRVAGIKPALAGKP
jgi:hypothetical protein